MIEPSIDMIESEDESMLLQWKSKWNPLVVKIKVIDTIQHQFAEAKKTVRFVLLQVIT